MGKEALKALVNPIAFGTAKAAKKFGGETAASVVSPQTEIGVPKVAETLGLTEPAVPSVPSGTSAEDERAVALERERLERRRRGRGGTILTSPTGAPLGLPGSAPSLRGGATILGG